MSVLLTKFRECREENHTPYRCDQIEKTPEVKVRTMIENKMTEVLIRWQTIKLVFSYDDLLFGV